jgi:pyridoxine 4-dehydrogenase
VPLEDQLAVLVELHKEGKIRHIGLSQVTLEQLRAALALAPVATVQNLYDLANRAAEDVLDFCMQEQLGLIPWFPIATGQLAWSGGPLDAVAARTGATPSQLALARLLRRSPVMLPIPGTSSVPHLEENIAAATIKLSDEQFDELARSV